MSIGFASFGDNLKISRKASIYSPEKISIGNNVRIDDFCILSGRINIGSNIHISAYVALYGQAGITIQDFSGISARCTLYSAIDDLSGDYLVGPHHPVETTKLIKGEIIIEKYVQIGCNSVVFPAVKISDGCVVGAHSIVKTNTTPWGVYAGIPCKRIKDRNNGLLTKLY